MGNITSFPMLVGGALENCCGSTIENGNVNGVSHQVLKGSVVLKKTNLLDMTNCMASVFDHFNEFFGKHVLIQLISAAYFDPVNPKHGKLGKADHIEKWISTFTSVDADDEAIFDIKFGWDELMGVPGAIKIENHHPYPFYLKTLTLESVPGHASPVHFACNSWIYPVHRYNHDRVFLANKVFAYVRRRIIDCE